MVALQPRGRVQAGLAPGAQVLHRQRGLRQPRKVPPIRRHQGGWREVSSEFRCNREGEAKFLRCLLYYEGAFSIMEPADFSSISL